MLTPGECQSEIPGSPVTLNISSVIQSVYVPLATFDKLKFGDRTPNQYELGWPKGPHTQQHHKESGPLAIASGTPLPVHTAPTRNCGQPCASTGPVGACYAFHS